jgi:formylmethanofuran dehydrogenase subunit A
MPIYAEKLTVPANTSEANPTSLDIFIKEQYITRMEVGFEDGCAWMVKARIQYGIKQFFPDRPETWLIGNNETVGWDERFTMPSPNEILTVYAASPDTKHDHNVYIRIMTLPKGFYFLETLLQKLSKLWEKIIG